MTKDKVKKNAQAAIYRALHKDEINERRRVWALAHPDYDKLRCREYRKNHLSEEQENSKAYRKEHAEEIKERKHKYYADNRDLVRGRNRQHTIGISPEDYNLLFESQRGRCAVCGIHQDELKRALHADHDHETGRIRGLLCSNCNTGIGLLRDWPELLRAAANYLDRYK